MEQKLKNCSIQPKHSPIILFPFSSKSLIKTTVCLERRDRGCSKVKQDMQVVSLCFWRLWEAPAGSKPMYSLKSYMWPKSHLSLWGNLLLKCCWTQLCLLCSRGISLPRFFGAFWHQVQISQTAAKAQPLLAGPKEERQAMPLHMHSHAWISLLL